MSQWAREHPDQMTDIAALPLSGQRASLADAMRGNRREERAEALRNASRAAQKARDEMLYGFSAEKDGRRVDPVEIMPEPHKANVRHYEQLLAEAREQERQEHHDDLRKDAEEDAAIEAEEAENQ